MARRDEDAGKNTLPKRSRAVDRMADRIVAKVNGKGEDILTVRSTAGNPFFSKPNRKDAERSAVTINDGARIQFEEARKLLGRRVVGFIANPYDLEIFFHDNTKLTLAVGGEGFEIIVSQTEKPAKKKQ